MKSFLLFAAVLSLGVNVVLGDGVTTGSATPPNAAEARQAQLNAAWSKSLARAIKDFPAMADRNSPVYRTAKKLCEDAKKDSTHPYHDTVYNDPEAPWMFVSCASKLLADSLPHLVVDSVGKYTPIEGYAWLNNNDPDDFRVVRKPGAEATGVSSPIPPQSNVQTLRDSLKIGQFVVALSDDMSIRSNSSGWEVTSGEVYKFNGFAADGMMILLVDNVVVNARPENFVAVPDKDLARAAMKYAAEVKEAKEGPEQAASSSPQPGAIAAMRGDWQERMGAWRGPDGSVVHFSGQQVIIPQGVRGTYRIHHRAVENDMEQAICQRDSAIASGQMSEVDADAQFNSWLSNKRQQEALAAAANDMNRRVDDANRKLDEQKRKVEEMQRRLHMNNL